MTNRLGMGAGAAMLVFTLAMFFNIPTTLTPHCGNDGVQGMNEHVQKYSRPVAEAQTVPPTRSEEHTGGDEPPSAEGDTKTYRAAPDILTTTERSESSSGSSSSHDAPSVSSVQP